MRRVRTSRLGVTLATGEMCNGGSGSRGRSFDHRRFGVARAVTVGQLGVRRCLTRAIHHAYHCPSAFPMIPRLPPVLASTRPFLAPVSAIEVSRHGQPHQDGAEIRVQDSPHRHLPVLTVRHRCLDRVLLSAFGNERLKASRATSVTFRAARRSGSGRSHHQLKLAVRV